MNFLNRFLNKHGLLKKDIYITFVNPDVSADKLIEKNDLVISPPYTLTHSIAKYKKAPSIFYDPFAELSDSNNLDLIQTYENLEKWIRKKISV
jgi:polysaccharide biosynthesis PFTS motif protein